MGSAWLLRLPAAAAISFTSAAFCCVAGPFVLRVVKRDISDTCPLG